MFELASALFSIADANEFRFARFYIVCEAVPLEALGNPLIVCGLPDTSVDCQSVAKTQNWIPDAAWKKHSNFASKNVAAGYILELYAHTLLEIYSPGYRAGIPCD